VGGVGQAQAPGSDSHDTLNSRVIPVVFVPGVMGSRLDMNGAVSDWDPDDSTEMAGWLTVTRRTVMRDISFRKPATVMTGLDSIDVHLGENGIVAVRPLDDIMSRARLIDIALDKITPKPAARGRPSLVKRFYEERGWGTGVWTFYGRFLMDLEESLNPGSHGGELRPVYCVGYDWRQSNKDSGKRLKERIDEILQKHKAAKKIIVVTHSMGGLVTRSALVQGAKDKIQGVVHTVMPSDGAAVAYRRFLTGAREELGETESGLRSILGPTRLHYTVMQSVLRGPVELLPHDAYPEVFLRFHGGITNKFFQKVFDEYARTEPPGIVIPAGTEDDSANFDETFTADDVNNLRARLRESGAFASTIAGQFHPNTILLFGTKRVTDTEFDWTRGKPTPDGSNMVAMCIRTKDGDGTVPRASSFFAASSPIERDDTTDVEHASCFGVPAFRQKVREAVVSLAARE
jgi:pimeloyl-ACP methyl ester carboxylesterase